MQARCTAGKRWPQKSGAGVGGAECGAQVGGSPTATRLCSTRKPQRYGSLSARQSRPAVRVKARDGVQCAPLSS